MASGSWGSRTRRTPEDSVKEFQIDSGGGCVAPSADTVNDGTYPLGRTLYIYVNKEKLAVEPGAQGRSSTST